MFITNFQRYITYCIRITRVKVSLITLKYNDKLMYFIILTNIQLSIGLCLSCKIARLIKNSWSLIVTGKTSNLITNKNKNYIIIIKCFIQNRVLLAGQPQAMLCPSTKMIM